MTREIHADVELSWTIEVPDDTELKSVEEFREGLLYELGFDYRDDVLEYEIDVQREVENE